MYKRLPVNYVNIKYIQDLKLFVFERSEESVERKIVVYDAHEYYRNKYE